MAQTCPTCNQALKPVMNIPGLRRLTYPHVCKQIPKLGPAYVNQQLIQGTGTEWMPQAYAEYYARYPAVYAAVKLRADAMLAAPLRVYRRSQDDSLESLPGDHPLMQLMRKVNPWWTAGDLLRATSMYLDLWGSVFWVLKKAGPQSSPTEIWIPRPDRMRIVPSRDNYIEGFWYQAAIGTKIPFRPDEVIWLRQLNPLDEYAGLSPIAPARASIDMGHEGITHNRNIFKNGMLWGNIALAAKDGAAITEEQAVELREYLKQRYSRPENSHIPLIMGNFDAKNLGLTNRDMEFMAALRWSLEDVARVYSIPKPMLGDLERATYENIDAAERIFWRSSMVPHLRFIQDELTEMLAPMFGSDLLFAFDLDQIEALQEDANAVSQRYIAEVQAGIKTINEVRDIEGLEPVPWGDVAWMPFGVQPVSSPEDMVAPSIQEGGAAMMETSRGILAGPSWQHYVAKRYPDDVIEKIIRLHGRLLDKVDTEFRALQSGLFRDQRREVLRRASLERAIDQYQQKALPEIQLFNLGEWVQRFTTNGTSLYRSAIIAMAAQQSNAFALGVSFDLSKIQTWMDNRIAFWATQVNEETGRLLVQELEEAISQGESIRQIQQRIEQVFDFSDIVRSERIARTETQAMLNEAAVETYRQSGVVDEKIWLATLDDRVRDTHAEAHRQIVPIEANFIVGGEAISHPGEGSPSNAINCRCTVAPIVRRRAWHSPLAAIMSGQKED